MADRAVHLPPRLQIPFYKGRGFPRRSAHVRGRLVKSKFRGCDSDYVRPGATADGVGSDCGGGDKPTSVLAQVRPRRVNAVPRTSGIPMSDSPIKAFEINGAP
jgi:hypothetical protein